MKFPEAFILTKYLGMYGRARYITLDWAEDYYSVGTSVMLTLPLDDFSRGITEGMYINIPDANRTRSAIIEGIKKSESSTDTVTLKAVPLKAITKRRINLRDGNDAVAKANFGFDAVPTQAASAQTLSVSSCESILKIYIDRHLVHPADANRKFPLLTLASSLGRGKSAAWLANHGAQLSDTLEAVSRYSDIGLNFYISGASMIADVIIGKDRSVNNTQGNAPVQFSLLNRNTSGVVYDKDLTKFKNTLYAEGDVLSTGLTAMRLVYDGVVPSGAERRETFANVSSGDLIETDVSLSYEQIGRQKLEGFKATESVTASVIDGGSLLYLKDWDIGDIVTVYSKNGGYSADVRITACRQTVDSSGVKITPTFGDAPNVSTILKNTLYK